MTILKQYYKIIDAEISLESDSEEFLDVFDKDYRWFKTDSLSGEGKLSFSVILENDTVTQDNQIFSLKGHPNRLKYAYQLVLKEIFNNIREYFLIHAGVAGKDGKVMIIAGPPGVGKTTMVSELVKNGFDFFSDDFCPIHKTTGLVYPFPRTMWKVSETQIPGSLRKNKIPAVAEGHIADKPGKIGCVIILDAEKASRDFHQLEIGLKHGEESVIYELQKINGVTSEQIGLSEWRIQYPVKQGFNKKIREILEKHETGIWNVFLDDPLSPDFTKEPVLTRISSHETAFHLIKDFKNQIISKEISLTDILMKLTAFLDNVPCYRLSVGKFDAMKDILIQSAEAVL